MADGVQITFRGDISDVVKKAQQIPGEVDRAARKGRRSWEGGGTEPGTRDQYRKTAGMATEIEKQEQERQRREQEQRNKDYLKRLKWNSRLQEDQDNIAKKESERAAKAADWAKQFGDALQSRLMGAIGPAALAMKAIEIGWGSVIRMIGNMVETGNTKLEAGISYTDTRALEMFANVGTASNDEVRGMAANAQRTANAAVSGGPGSEGAQAFAYFKMTDFEKYRKEGVPMAELISNMARTYQEKGGGPEYESRAQQLLGSNWRKLSALLAIEARAQKQGGSAMEDIESMPTMSSQYIRAMRYRTEAYKMTPGELMGGVPGGGPSQMLTNVSSLQAMGGGDILSAIARGPQERTATAAENIERNTAEMANSMRATYVGPFRPVIVSK